MFWREVENHPGISATDVREAVDNVLGLTMTDIIKGEVKDAG